MRWLTGLIAAICLGQSFEAVPAAARQGDTVRVRGPAAALVARMDGRIVRMFPQQEGGALGLMPVPALTRPGTYALKILGTGGTVLDRLTVTVRDARFARQDVQLGKAQRELKPAPGETELVAGFRNLVTETRYWTEPLAAPLPGCMISRFGVQRYWNGKPTGNYHAGIDQRSPAGKPVRAVAAGTVQIGRMLTVQGGTVGIDHGQGLESIYQHLSGFAAREGQRVKKGEAVGYVGSTGRSTAPHLHWSLYVNGVPVNPSQWLSLSPCASARKRRATS